MPDLPQENPSGPSLSNPESDPKPGARTLRIQLFGSLMVYLEQNGSRQMVQLPPGRVSDLLAYLALNAPAGITRSRLAGLLDPDKPEAAARRTLSDALYRLRSKLETHESWIITEGETVRLNDTGLWVDVTAFKQALNRRELTSLQEAVELYSGDLLEDLDEDWILSHRATLRRQYQETLEQVSRAFMQAQKLPEALTYAHRWAVADPLCEEAHLTVMQLFARMGRYAAALEQYERLRNLLADELGAQPLLETRLLAESIRAEHQAINKGEKSQRAFVGRRLERTSLLEHIERAQRGSGGLVLVEGEPGVGKTRLLEEVASGASWRGLCVAWGKASPISGTSSYSPLDFALQAATAGPRADLLRTMLDPATLKVASFLAPRLQADSLGPITITPEMPEAILQVCRALSEVSPYVYVFDDVQWAGPAFWGVIDRLVREIEKSRVLIILSYRSEEMRVNSIGWEQLQALDRNAAPQKYWLGGLEYGECLELARQLNQPSEQEYVLNLYEHTGGNPLFFSEVINQPGRTSPSYEALLQQRWSILAPQSMMSLQAAAVLGREFTHAVWQELAGNHVIIDLPVCLEKRFLKETERGYAFPHDLIRQFVYQTLADTQRRELHYLAGTVLQRENMEASQLAWHFEQGQEWGLAISYYLQAAELARKGYAFTASLDYNQRGMDLLPKLPEPTLQRINLLRQRQQVLGLQMRAEELRRVVAELEKAAQEANDDGALLEALQAQVNLSVFDSNWEQMLKTGLKAIDLAGKTGDRQIEAQLHCLLGWHLSDACGRHPEAIPHLEAAINLSQEAGDLVTMTSAQSHLAFALYMLGRLREARRFTEAVIQAAEGLPDLRLSYADALQVTGLVDVGLANWEDALAALRLAVKIKQDLGDQWSLGEAMFDIAVAAMPAGQHVEARQVLDFLLNALSMADQLSSMNNFMWVSALSAQLFVQEGNLAKAEATLAGMKEWMGKTASGRAVMLAYGALGQLHMAKSQFPQACAVLRRAAALWQEMPSSEVGPLLYAALAAARCGELQEGQGYLAQAEEALRSTEVVRFDVLRFLTRFELYGCFEDLEAAWKEIQRQARAFRDPELQLAFLERVPLHREVAQKYEDLLPAPIQKMVKLARVEAPLGKRLGEQDYIDIHWTLDGGKVDREAFQRGGKVGLRRFRLRRLLEEARTQGASPTDADLADALGVDRRTILRDVAELRLQGQQIPTRKRAHE